MATEHQIKPKRSFGGGHSLLPASRDGPRYEAILNRRPPSYTIISWTLGRGSVIWRIWPAVLLHTIFAVAVVSLSLTTNFKLNIPSVMLTVLGVVIGFVIAYRVGSGYDRFWMGRVCWADLIRNSRTMGRLVWFHVPPLVSPKTPQEIASGKAVRTTEELMKVMAEKRLALDLISGFAVATKHHLRSELGIYFEDLFHLVKPLHERTHHKHKHPRTQPETGQSTSVATHPITDPVIVATDSYGTFNDDPHKAALLGPRIRPHVRRSNSEISSRSSTSIQQPLLPSTSPTDENFMSKASTDLIPFAGMISSIRRDFWKKLTASRQLEVLPPNVLAGREQVDAETGIARPKFTGVEKRILTDKMGHTRLAGDGHNLPLEILHCLSDWCAILEDRNTVPGNSMAGLLTCIAMMEDSLSSMEKILTTPLPFVYSVHIRHTVWLYLFFLPFQLVEQFGWHSIAGVFTASFIYLGFLAAGEEIEQPFGYEDNDLDLDLFCHEIIYPDMERLKMIHCLNAYFAPHHEGKNHPSQLLVDTSDPADGAQGDPNVFSL